MEDDVWASSESGFVNNTHRQYNEGRIMFGMCCHPCHFLPNLTIERFSLKREKKTEEER